MANSDSPQASTVPPPENSSEKSTPSKPAKSPPPPEKSSTSPESSPSSSSGKTPSPTSPPPPPSSPHSPTPPAKSEQSAPAPPPPTADPLPVPSTPADPTPPEDSSTPSNPSPKPKPTPSHSQSQPSEDSVPAASSTPASPGDDEESQSHDPTTKFSPPSNNSTQLPSNLVPSPPGVPSPPTTSGTPNLSTPSTATPSQSGNDRSASSSRSVPAVDPFVSSVSHDADHRQAITAGVVIGILGALLLVGLIAAILYLRNKRKTTRRCKPPVPPSPYTSSQSSGPVMMHPHGSAASSPASVGLGNSKWFTYEELSLATNGFSSHSILGSGGFGYVYKGVLEDGREVAVKKLKAGGGQGDREFKSEVEIISRVHHRHLVSLVGFCINGLDRALVYEFVPNNALHHHLHSSCQAVMGWPNRVKVVAGSAKGIAYLHEDCHPRIIHRDIKSANILLENNYEAKVADFGLAKLAQELDANTHVSTRVMGTFGYMAPEYATSGKLSEKSDVFSFGVVVLELITGRKPVDEKQPVGEESLVEWARPLLTKALDTEDFEELADPRLGGNYDRAEMFRMIEAAAACVRHSANKRPKMSQLARALDFMSEPSPDLLRGMKPGESEIINSREQSAQIRMFQRMAFDCQDASSSELYSSQGSWRSDSDRSV